MSTLDLVEKQVTNEMYNHLVYFNIAGAFDLASLEGWSKLYFKQAIEERGHALKFTEYLLGHGHCASICNIPAVPSFVGKSPTEMLEAAAALEKKTTGEIYAIAEAAAKERDHQTYSLLQWFLDEQVSEEDEARKRLDQVRMNPQAAFLMNLELQED